MKAHQSIVVDTPKKLGLRKTIKAARQTCAKSRIAGVHKLGCLCRASVAIANFKLYTRLQPKIEVAVEHHSILAKIRDAVTSALNTLTQVRTLAEYFSEQSTLFWQAATLPRRSSNFARRYGCGCFRVSSPTVSISYALKLRSRLLLATRVSWVAFLAECVAMMQCFRSRSRRAPFVEVEVVADDARPGSAPERRMGEMRQRNRFVQALRSVVLALENEQHQKEQEVAQIQKATFTQERKARAAQRRTREQTMRWHRRTDLTMDEIMPDPHRPNAQVRCV